MHNLFFSLLMMSTLSAERISGWHWYKEQPLEVKARAPKSVAQKPSSQTPTPPSVKEVFEASLQKAVDNPTPSNVKAAYIAHVQMVNHASKFADQWMQASLHEGGHVLNPRDNMNQFHRQVKEAEDKKELTKALTALSKTHGIFFMVAKGCPYCTKFIPVVKRFAEDYGFDVLAVGNVSPNDYPFKVVSDNGLTHALNTQNIYPALFLVNTQTKDVYPLSWGLSSPEDLDQNARLVLNHMKSNEKGLS